MEREKKRAQIEALDNEVKELHPLLDDLFRDMEGIAYVEYTHGQDEMGADFVLEKVDPNLGVSTYVGVVVKAQKILQNFTDVERQIDECQVRRLIQNGKKEVRLPEVWVISSKGYSNNAKEKISDKFPTRTIHFFDSDWLVDQVDRHLPLFWHQLPTATGSYLSGITKSIAVLDAQTSVLVLPGSKTPDIELDIAEIETDKYKKSNSKKKLHLVNLSEEILRNKISLLEAEMGYGKSKLARKIVVDFSNPDVLKDTNFLPIFQSFKEFSDQKHSSLEDFLKAKLGASCYAESKSNEYKFLLVLDGIDEADNDPDICTEVIGRLVTQVKDSTKIHVLLTSRPFKLLEDVPGFYASAKRYQIRPISTTKLIKFIREVCESTNLPKRLYEDLAKSDLFKQLPQNPIAASLLSNLLAQQKGELPSNLTELYSKSVEYMLGRWDKRRLISTERHYKTVERLARYLARYMIENQLIYISKDEARDMCDAFLSERNIGAPVDEVFEYLLIRTSILGQIEDTGTIFFRHRSFAEYLYAVDAHAHRNMPINDRAFHPYWMNIVFFYIGLLGECPDDLRSLASLELSNERTKLARLLQMGNYLLAGYQSPYKTTEDSLDMVFVEAALLYTQIKEGKSSIKFFNELSEMTILWLFSGLMKHGYGFEFFRRALIDTLLKIDTNLVLETNVKQVAQYFVAVTLAELDTDEGMVYLVKSYKTEDLPLPLSLGIRCEIEVSKKNFSNNQLIKGHEKRLRKLLTTDKMDKLSSQKTIDDLFEKPIKLLHGTSKGHH
ncbi:NACHT domain-containing protein [Thiobacillus sp.]|uniref:NACHT domain-containing protein n=1 Tax=Thiobacillus sp. TaxID=924 RepID=UPI0017BC8A2F|nr:NACHT domain-containing protein [Thiobacillus sp.]MBC2732018.1 NACHT domain-containing protein [Thiobacillus sp.]MBC2740756.1 NACHT domain-containing protein [Thiobacillus sp.]MBC2759948.1 NACHT domain-containing protein [Thiobacillus sp.]